MLKLEQRAHLGAHGVCGLPVGELSSIVGAARGYVLAETVVEAAAPGQCVALLVTVRHLEHELSALRIGGHVGPIGLQPETTDRPEGSGDLGFHREKTDRRWSGWMTVLVSPPSECQLDLRVLHGAVCSG